MDATRFLNCCIILPVEKNPRGRANFTVSRGITPLIIDDLDGFVEVLLIVINYAGTICTTGNFTDTTDIIGYNVVSVGQNSGIPIHDLLSIDF